MQERWWERPVCIVCEYWWVAVLAIALGLTAYFMRGYWMPAIGMTPVPTATQPGPSAVPATAAVAPSATPEGTTAFQDPAGNYKLEHPTDWTREDVGDQVQAWQLPEGAEVSVHAEPAQPGDTLESWAEEVVARMQYAVLAQSNVSVGGEPGIRQDVAYTRSGPRIAVGYLMMHGGQKYQIALAGLDDLSADEQQRLIEQFEAMLKTFNFRR